MLKPLETKEKREQRIRRQNIILSIIIAVAMIAGTIGWALKTHETEQQYNYNGFKFTRSENYWKTFVKVYNKNFLLQTSFLPQEVENISITGTLNLEKFLDKTLYLVIFSRAEQQAAQELAINLQYFVKRIQVACSLENANESFCIEKPVKSCDDVTLDSVVIIFEEKDEEGSINFEFGCLKISGKETEILKATDKTLFLIFGIIK